MINVQMSGLDEIIDRLQESPEVFRDARSRELEDIGSSCCPESGLGSAAPAASRTCRTFTWAAARAMWLSVRKPASF